MADDNKKPTARRPVSPETEALAAELSEARERLGILWGVNRPLTRREMARALGLSPTSGDDHLLKVERGKAKFSTPLRILLDIYLSGDALPPDYVEIFTPDRRFK